MPIVVTNSPILLGLLYQKEPYEEVDENGDITILGLPLGSAWVEESIVPKDYFPIAARKIEITCKELPDIPHIVRRTIKHIGYDCDYEVEVITRDQSSDIAGAVNGCLANEFFSGSNDTLGAGDQSIVYGYACNETDEMLPLPVVLAHRIARRLIEARRSGHR